MASYTLVKKYFLLLNRNNNLCFLSTANTLKLSITIVDRMLGQQLEENSTAHGLSIGDFVEHLENTYIFSLTSPRKGSLVIKGQCPDLQNLERLWREYESGDLNGAAKRVLVSDDINRKINLVIEKDNYLRCKKALNGELGR